MIKRAFITFVYGENYENLASLLKKSIEKFSNYSLKIYYKDDFNIKLDDGIFNSSHGYIYKILSCIKSLEEYDEVVWIDTDCIVTNYIDKIWFENYRIKNYPLLPKYRFNLFDNKIHNQPEINDQLFLTNAKQKIGVNSTLRNFYSQACLMFLNKNCSLFYHEVLKYFNDFNNDIFPNGDETIINCLLWKYNHLDDLGDIFLCSEFFNENLLKFFNIKNRNEFSNIFNYKPTHNVFENILFLHGSKNPELIETLLNELIKTKYMPESYKYYKEEIKTFFNKKIAKNKKILDVGPGIGTYSELLSPLGFKLDCVEIFEPYVEIYNLNKKYNNVYIANVMDFDLTNYDFIILGDILEHLTIDDGQKLINQITSNGKDCLVAIPYQMEQGESHDNIYETHLQPDLTPQVMSERYPNLTMLYSNEFYGYYVNNTIKLKDEKAYVYYCDENYIDIVKSSIKSIRQTSNIPIYVYLINSIENINIDNVYTINWFVELSGISEFVNTNTNYYIKRDNNKIHNLLIERPNIVKNCLENYATTVAYIDSDSIATKYVNKIFDYYNPDTQYPYFVEGIYNFIYVNDRGYINNDLKTTLEYPACQLFNVDQNVRQSYRQTGYFVAGQNTLDFLDEWYWMCHHPKITNNISHYAPFNEETILNVLLWKYNIQDGLPYLYVNGGLNEINEINTKLKFNGNKQNIRDWFSLPKNNETLLFFHGEKNIENMEKMILELNKQTKTKILFLAPHLSTGGMPAFLLKRVEALVKFPELFEIFVVEYSNFSDKYAVQKNKIKELIGDNLISLGYVSSPKNRLIDIIKDNNIDIVHIEEMSEGFESFNQLPDDIIKQLYSNNRTWKMVETCHNVWFDPNTMKKYHPDAYAFCTPWHKEMSFSAMPSYSEIIEFPIENKKITGRKTKIQQLLELDPNKKHVINVGLWTSGKNQKEGVEIARLVEKTNPEIQFHFIGNCAENFKDYWLPIISDLPTNVKIWEEKANVDEFMLAADLFMFNSTWECNPLVLKEAISHDLKILARNLPQYMNIYTPYITEIDDDITKSKDKLIELLYSDIEYSKPKNQLAEFEIKLVNFYNKVNTFEPKKTEEKISISQHFVLQPFIEVSGESNSVFRIKFFDEKNICHYNNKFNINHWVKLNRTYYTKWRTEVWQDDTIIYNDTLNLENKRVYISFDSSSLGDSIAWIPYAQKFKEKHNCQLIVSTFWNQLFKNSYPDIEFVEPNTVVPNLIAMYKLGCYFNEYSEPELPNTIPLQKVATNILGLPFEEIKPTLDFTPGVRPYKDKFVTIATESTAGLKLWTKEGWEGVAEYLTKNGYKVFNVAKDGQKLKNVTNIKNTSVENGMNYIYHSDFFIGLSSGMSWVAWVLNKHVVLISNFTNNEHEFQSDCTKIYNHNVCNSCWTKPENRFDKGDWNWCPQHKGTNRQFECHTSITALDVINKLGINPTIT